jgi:RNA polymerase sigma-70 factor (ECF subfamily)
VTIGGDAVYMMCRTMNPSDAQLTEQCRAGECNAFGELVRRNQDAVFNLVWRMTGNWHEAADITQEAFIRAFRKLNSYRPDHPFRNWILGIGANLARNRFRSLSRRTQREQAAFELQDAEFHAPCGEPDPDLEAALAQVPEALRTALVLKHMEGLSYEEVARALRIGVSAAKMRVARGRDELVHLLAAQRSQRHE